LAGKIIKGEHHMQFSGKALLRSSSALVLGLALAGCAQQSIKPQASAHPPVMTQAVQKQMTADQALQLLKDGNARFVSGKPNAYDLPMQIKITGKEGQYPFVSIVSCIDSRSEPGQVFDLGVGDAFSARVAGNIVNEDILGSLEFASKAAGTKLIVILGHTSCGAVKGACDNVAMGNLTGLLAKIRPAVDATSDVHGHDRSSSNYPFVNAVAEKNVHLTVQTLLDKSPVLRDMVAKNEIKVVGAMLDVTTGQVQFY
jgi:carbonic anhydrase